jgi:hypothetical protein
MRTVLPVLVLCLASGGVARGEAVVVSPRTVTTVTYEVPHSDLSLAVLGRLSLPGSDHIDRSGFLTYDDLFETGYGLSVEANLLFRLDPYWRLGGYLSLGWDQFGGSRSVDDFGDTVEPDRMTIYTVLVGIKSRAYFGPGFFGDAYLGLGIARYNAVDATFVLSGIPYPDQELFHASTRFALDLGGRIGWGTEHVAATLGLGLRFMDGPGRGKDVTSEIDPESMVNFILDLGIQFTF